MRLPILTEPNPILASATVDVRDFDEELKELVHEMFETMYGSGGAGLAAPQVGHLLSIFVAHWSVEDGPVCMVNPVIVSSSGSSRDTEGCLSLPGLNAPIDRAASVTVSWKDLDGEDQTRTFKGLGARVIQHEIDHLLGRTLLDLVSRQIKRHYLRTERKRRKSLTV